MTEEIVARPCLRSSWTQEEDQMLTELVKEHGSKNWALIAQFLDGRIGKQCRERWRNHLDPNIRRDRFTDAEDKQIIKLVEKMGTRWARISEQLPGRTENAIKNRYYCYLARKAPVAKGKSGRGRKPNPRPKVVSRHAPPPVSEPEPSYHHNMRVVTASPPSDTHKSHEEVMAWQRTRAAAAAGGGGGGGGVHPTHHARGGYKSHEEERGYGQHEEERGYGQPHGRVDASPEWFTGAPSSPLESPRPKTLLPSMQWVESVTLHTGQPNYPSHPPHHQQHQHYQHQDQQPPPPQHRMCYASAPLSPLVPESPHIITSFSPSPCYSKSRGGGVVEPRGYDLDAAQTLCDLLHSPS